MTKAIGGTLLLCVLCRAAFAIIISPFTDTDTFVRSAKDIVVAECVSIPTNRPVLVGGHWVTAELRDGLYKVEVNIIRTLKGSKETGKQIIATIYLMRPGQRYFLSSRGGAVGESGGVPGTDFMAIPQLSVIEVLSNLDLKTLDGKDLKEQVQYIFSRHLFEVESRLAPLLEEKGLLEKAVSDRRYEWYESDGALKIGRITELSTDTDGHHLVWLDLAGNKLEWSASLPGKTGFLYFEKVGLPRTPYWEFSPCGATKIEELADKPLKAKFCGMYTPGRGQIGWAGGLQSIQVSLGQVLLARTVDAPGTIFIIQIVGQNQDQERMLVKYAIIHR